MIVNDNTLSSTFPVLGQENIIEINFKQIQAMYVLRKIEARSCNHYFSGTAISIIYSECVPVDFGIQHAM